VGKEHERSPDCAAERLLTALSGKWKAGIICRLSAGPCRYTELRAAIPGLSDKMLSQRLRGLIDKGLVARMPSRAAPAIYLLTSKGKLLESCLQRMCAWGQAHSRALEPEIGTVRPCAMHPRHR
jgi:DNA-binding HxlR family transcriptional regulator